MNYKVNFKFRFKNRLTNKNQEDIKASLEKLSGEDTLIKVTRLCRTKLEGSIIKPSYNKIGKKPNPRNSFALIKRVKLAAEVDTVKIDIVEDKKK